MQGMPPKLSPTSYAVLGLLSSGPFSAYELTKHMKRSALAELWPRTEASIYKEPKVLVAHGLATATGDATGARPRTVYTITPAGRRALQAWLRTPGEGLVFECEAAVKAFFGDAGRLEDLQAQLRTLSRAIAAAEPSPVAQLHELRDGPVRFPERLHYTAMSADLIARVRLAVTSWAADWADRTEQWSTVELDDASRREAVAVLDERLADAERAMAAASA
jgi:PadR family transcriptional regulator, regulatory protein AphA